ncbi:response regulator [Fibrella aquatilis]|uniref:Response regulator transcription factor n=1 Tax=Fibrella aquatilis TaxID=2817059 RepID=A0A939G7H0_9BACT|nr:response regulator transcription factor [Fibrella aquatilis]MBO0933837.1 response regulator transcription factor [Fibrella aquatilis]
MPATVLLLDDHPLIVNGLAHFLTNTTDLDVVGKAHAPAEALALLNTTPTDVLVSDMRFEGDSLNGTTLMLRAREKQPGLRVVFYTMIEKSTDVREAVLAGANGYVLKKYDADEIGRAIRAVLRPNGQYFSPELVSILAQLSPSALHHDEQPDPLRAITAREKEIMLLIAREFTVGQIARQLSLSESTVHSHRTNLMTKLGVTSSVGVAHFAFKYGLLN